MASTRAASADIGDMARQAVEQSVEEVIRQDLGPRVEPTARPGVHMIQLPVVINTSPWRFVWGFGLLAIIDLAFHAAAGAAAASVGAKGNGLAVTPLVLQMGALAGVTKSAMSTFREVVTTASKVNFIFRVLIMLISSSFGICPLLVTEVGNIALGEAKKKLLISGVVAAVPLFFESVRSLKPGLDDEGKPEYFRWVFAIFLIPFDALGGYVFARMGANQGMEISKFSAACSAGAVFGTLTFLSRAVTGIIVFSSVCAGRQNSDLFGVYEATLTDPIPVTEDEMKAVYSGLIKLMSRLAHLMLGCVSCCLCCLPCINRRRYEKWRKEVEDHSMEVGLENFGI